jgi:cytochrome b pre-mRNA-processing protein 3
MNTKYIILYNNFIRLTRNKNLYKSLDTQDTFSDRITIFLAHFAFFLKVNKKNYNKDKLQKIYDFIFRQLELSIREIGYGDQSINKKMKDYINSFHSILSDIHFWDNLNSDQKIQKLKPYLGNFKDIIDLVVYFDNFNIDLSKNKLNF